MTASYSLQEFVGQGVLKDTLDVLEADGWDDVPTVKMMTASEMETLQLTDAQQDALELRTYLHDRNLMQYAEKLESLQKPLPDLLSTPPSELVALYGMRRGHVARFVDRSNACGVQLPPNLALPPRKRGLASSIGEGDYSFISRQSGAPEVSPRSSIHSNSSLHRRRTSHDQLLMESRQTSRMNGFEPKDSAKMNGFEPRESAKMSGLELNGSHKDGYEERPGEETPLAPAPLKGIVARSQPQSRFCGLMRPSQIVDDVTPLSVLEKIYVQKLTPEHKKGSDPWTTGDLKIPPPIKVAELWSNKPTLLLCIRRPGCVMCRAEAHQLYAQKPVFDAMGVQLVAILNEYIDDEVRTFWPRYWGGMVVVDRNRDFFKALGGGKLRKDDLVTGFIFNSQARRNWKRATATGFEYNLIGEGNIKGGMYIVGPGKTGVAYQFIERTFGDWAPLEEVLDVCTKIQVPPPNKKTETITENSMSEEWSI